MWAEIRATIIREIVEAGIPTRGTGEEITSALVGTVLNAARIGRGYLSEFAEQVKLYRDPEREWRIDLDGAIALDDERLGSFVVLIRLRRLGETVATAI